jgi:hypothetical protein
MGKKERKITTAEERRKADFEKTALELMNQGYKRTELTFDELKLSILVLLVGLPCTIVALFAFVFIHPDKFVLLSNIELLGCAILLLLLIFLHAFMQVLLFSIFCQNGIKDIVFCFRWRSLTLYSECKVPLKKEQLIIVNIIPFIVLGLVPTIIALIVGSIMLFILGLVMILAGSGDIIYVYMLFKYKAKGNDVIFFDAPSQPGCIVFDR